MASRSMKNRPGIRKKHRFIGLGVFAAILLTVLVAGGAAVYALGNSWIGEWADYDVSDAASLNTSQPTTVLASDETTLLARFQIENRDPVGLDEISQYVLEGTVATEDERFYEHGGFDLWGIMRAAFVTLTGSGREGASTITQQLVRNTILADEMDDISFARKVREIYLSTKIEQEYSKDEILLMYLNTINYGNATYGIQAASQRYFSKDASDLTLAEAATLIGIPQSPTYNEPLQHADNCLERRNVVLDRMLSNGYITQEEHDAAAAEPLVVNESVPTDDGIEAYPYFTSYVRSYLTENYSNLDIMKGGLTVVTTLDVSTQEAAEEAIRAKEATLSDSISGSLVAIDPDTGYVRALVGGKDWDTSQMNLATGEGTSATNPGRPCGSTFKTFTLIAALEAGISPQTTVDCSSPATIPNTGYDSTNQLQNIDNINYGTQTIQGAFERSSNTGFVRLEMALGIDKVIEVAQRMGISSQLSANASLTLGQSNVTMLDMADAYASIANGGTHYDAQPVLRIYDADGSLIVDNSNPEGERVISAEVAHAATDVMKTVVTGYNGTGPEAALSNGQEVAAKTGTSSSYKDITFCGITPQLSVAIWFGDPSNVENIPAHTTAADVFSDFMDEVLAGQPIETFPEADDPEYTSFSDSTYRVGTSTYTYNYSYGYGSTSGSTDSSSGTYSGDSDGTYSGGTSSGADGSGSTTGNAGNTGTGGSGASGGSSSGGTGTGSGTGGASGGGSGGSSSGTGANSAGGSSLLSAA